MKAYQCFLGGRWMAQERGAFIEPENDKNEEQEEVDADGQDSDDNG